MKTVFTILLTLSFTLLLSQKLDTLIEIKAFTVQGIRQNDSLINQPSNPYIIKDSEVQNTPNQSISDLLDNAVGIDIRSRSGLGVQSDMSIRGGTYDQSLLLIDGVKMADPQTGHHMMDVPIFIDQVERIEQINNGGSRWFGPYAFSGAVNLVTKRADSSQLQLRFSGGQYGYLDAGASGSVVSKKTSTTISINRRQSYGYIANTDFDMSNVFINSNIDIKKYTLKFNGGITDKNFGAQNFYTSRFPSQYEATRTYFASLQTTLNYGSLKVTPRLYYRRHYDRFELYRESENWYEKAGDFLVLSRANDTVPSWYGGPNFHRSEVRGAELNFSYKSKLGTTNIGGEYRQELIRSNNLGELADTVLDYGNAMYTKAAERNNASVFFEHNLKIKKFRLSMGILGNFHSVYGNDFFPGIDLSYQLSKPLTVFIGINKNTRFPTFTDLYYNLGGAVGSIALLPEQSQNYQLGFGLRKKWFSGSITGFYREGQNLIDWIRKNGSDVTEAANLTAVNFIGIETEARINVQQTSSILKEISLRYTGMAADKSSEGFESNYVLDYLKHKLNVGINHSFTSRLALSWNIRYQYREGGYFNTATNTEVAFGGYTLVDLRLYQEIKKLYWYIEAANIFNQQYEDIGFVQQPGRWIRAGVKCNIYFKKKS